MNLLKTTNILDSSSPYSALFFDFLSYARGEGASDIHIQPSMDSIELRLRINGDMRTWKNLDLAHKQSFTNEVKKLTGLSIAICGRAQDGRASFPEMKLDLRASLLPTQYGEKIVLRLLDLSRIFSIDAIDFPASTKADLHKELESESGILLISGPTGSGKTTTLYSVLNSLDKNRLNIITVEDPVEYSFVGLTQVQVSKKLSFADALRSILRQDPDVILVGEIRDTETAELAMKAALTGHLVLSTVHANNSVEVLSRLLTLNVDPYLIRSCLKFSGAQRLLKTLCPRCSTPPSKEILEKIGNAISLTRPGPFDVDALRVHNSTGCEKCFEGYVKRVATLEYLTQEEIKNWPGDLASLEQVAPKCSLKDLTLEKTLKGELCAAEIFKV